MSLLKMYKACGDATKLKKRRWKKLREENSLEYKLTQEDIRLTTISDTDDINVRFIKRLHRQIRGTTKSRVQLSMIKLHLQKQESK